MQAQSGGFTIYPSQRQERVRISTWRGRAEVSPGGRAISPRSVQARLGRGFAAADGAGAEHQLLAGIARSPPRRRGQADRAGRGLLPGEKARATTKLFGRRQLHHP
ncbi:hypothetical protein ACU4GD_23655 [Cupriavidus basilensis]